MMVAYFKTIRFFPDYFEFATSVVELVKLLPVYRYCVDMFSYSGPLGILGSVEKQNTRC